MPEYLLGLDIGTSGCKAVVFDATGQVMAQADAEYPTYHPMPGWAEQHPDDWWNGVCRVTKALFGGSSVHPQDIAAIGVAGQGWSAVLIDKAGRALNRTPIWMDTRARQECEEAAARIGEETLFAVSGNPFQPTYTLPKLLWYNKHIPDLMARADKVLQSNGYVVYRLTGTAAQDLSQGYAFACFDMKKGCWDDGLVRAFGLNRHILPEIVSCHQVVGKITAEAARETGLWENTPVVAGGLDAACGTLGVGVIRNGQTQEQGGQAGGMSICMDRMLADERLILSRHVLDGLWLLQGGSVGGGGIVQWMRRELYRDDARITEDAGLLYETINKEAESVKPGCDGLVFLPYMAGERSPIWNPDAKGVLFGLDYAKTRSHVTRAGMEGVAYSLRHNCEVAAAAGADVSAFYAMGGAANSKVWTQIKADVTGRVIHVPSSDTATSLGAAILAGVGTGYFRDYEEAVNQTVRVHRTHYPDSANKEAYDRNYSRYLMLYTQLEGLMKEAAIESSSFT